MLTGRSVAPLKLAVEDIAELAAGQVPHRDEVVVLLIDVVARPAVGARSDLVVVDKDRLPPAGLRTLRNLVPQRWPHVLRHRRLIRTGEDERQEGVAVDAGGGVCARDAGESEQRW